MELLAAIEHLKQDVERDGAFAKVNKAGDPPNQLGLPGFVCYATSGGFGYGSLDEDRWGLHTIVAELHVARADLALAYRDAMAFFGPLTRVVFAAAATRFGGHVVQIGDGEAGSEQRPISYTLEPDEWNGVKTLALAYQIVVTTQEGATDD